MNVGNVASNLAVNSDDFDAAFDVVKARYEKEGVL